MGTQHQNIIEINGKKYDAATGRILDGDSPQLQEQKPQTPKPTVRIPHTSGGVVDGFRRRPQHAKKTVHKSQTLMRTAVKKPAKITKSKPLAPTIDKSHLGVKPSRQHVAQQTVLSPKISKYGDLQHRSSVIKKVQPLAVKHPSSPPPVIQSISTPVEGTGSQRTVAAHTLIEKAMASAHSHEQTAHKKHKRTRKLVHRLGVSSRVMAASSGVLAAVLLAGFFAVQNVPNLSMRVAAARAGFNASMPEYRPSGFSFKGPINYSAGQVRITFKSNIDDRTYSVTQRESSWNSDALLANFIVSNNKQYQTYLDRGRTLYIYDGSNATWVNNGVWYQIEGESDLTTDQLVRIAASI